MNVSSSYLTPPITTLYFCNCVDGYRLFQQLVRVGCLDAWRNQSCPSANLYSFCSGYEYRLGAVDALGEEVDCSSLLRRNDDPYSVAQV